MNDPVQSITSQVEVIYEKTLSEIEREETNLREQINRLEKKRNILGKKRDHVRQLRSLVENLTQAIIEAEEICEQEEEKKADLDVRIEKMSTNLERLQTESRRAEADHNQANKSKIEKYRALSKIVERFGDIKGRLPDSVLAGLEDATYDDTMSFEAVLPQRQKSKKPTLDNNIESLGIIDLDLDEALDVYEEDVVNEDDTILENGTSTRSLQPELEDSMMEDNEDLEDDPEFDEFEEELAKSESEDLSLDDDEYNFVNDEERENFIDLMREDDGFAPSLQGIQEKSKRVASNEEIRLREAIAPGQREDVSEPEVERAESPPIPADDEEIGGEGLAEETLEGSSEKIENNES